MWPRAYGAASLRQGGLILVTVATWQLMGCASTHRTIDLYSALSRGDTAAAEGETGSPYRLAHPSIPGPAAGEARHNQFSVSNPRVDGFVTTFQTRWRGFYQGALDRSSRYLPNMEHVLREENVPPELAYLPLIESGFRTQAVSHAGAVGPWQFIPATGRRYGLRIDGYVDERRDPVKSTYAAARYLKALYAQFGDWHLSLAAYNTGEMHIARVLEGGGAGDYWEMSERGYLAAETCDFVPQFLAALQIARAPEAYGFATPTTDPLEYDLVQVNRSVSLKTVAKLSNASVSAITELNPALHRGVTPPQGYIVRVPKGTKEIVEVALARMRHDAADLVPARTVLARTHNLRKGETLAAVAKLHGVSVAALMKANRIRTATRVAAGRVLRIPGTALQPKIATGKKPLVRLASRKSR